MAKKAKLRPISPPVDYEMEALGTCVTLLNGLPEETCLRVVRYLSNRYDRNAEDDNKPY